MLARMAIADREVTENAPARGLRSLWSGPVLPVGKGWSPKRWVAWFSLAVSAIVHAVIAKDSNAVIFGADEVGNLANSVFFADPNHVFFLAGSGYMPGLGLMISPVWLFTSDPAVAYRVAIAVVTVTGFACIWPFSRLAKQWGATPNAAIVVGAVISLAPARALHSNNVLAENLFVFLLAWLAVYTTVLAQRPSFRNGMTVGLIAGGVWWSHGRSLPILIVVGIGALYLLWRHRRAGLGIIATLGPTGVLGYLAYSAISTQFYPGDAREDDLITQVIDNTPIEIVDALASQFWYVLLAWSLLVPLGVIALVARARGAEATPERGAARWIVAALAVGFAHVVVLIAGAEPAHLRLDIHVYGRYLDAFTPVVAVIGLAVLLRGITKKLAITMVGYAAVAIAAFQVFTFPGIPAGGYWTSVHLYGIAAWMSPANIATDNLDPYGTMSAVGALTLALFIATLALRPRWGVLAIAVVFLMTTVAVDQFKLKDMEAEHRYVPAPSILLRNVPGHYPVAADAGVEEIFLNYNLLSYYSYPVHMAAWGVNDPVWANGSPLVLSSTDASYLAEAGAWPLNGSILGNVMVWVMPGEVRDELDARGLVAHPIEADELEGADAP